MLLKQNKIFAQSSFFLVVWYNVVTSWGNTILTMHVWVLILIIIITNVLCYSVWLSKNAFELICLSNQLSFLLTYQTINCREDLTWSVSTNLYNISFTTHLTAHNVRFCQENFTKKYTSVYISVLPCNLWTWEPENSFVKLRVDKQDPVSLANGRNDSQLLLTCFSAAQVAPSWCSMYRMSLCI